MSARWLVALALVSGCGRLQPRVVTVDGRAVEVATAGEGATTVVFEAGLGSDWTVWDDAASSVAQSARVFAYSRPGSGRSAPTSTPRDATHIVEELRALLAHQGSAPPWVLVGHSFGGTYMELFAKTHPEEVSALVLVEPRPAGFAAACEARGLRGCRIPADLARTLPEVQRDELAGFENVSGELGAAGGFGAYPVRVLTASAHGESAEWESLWSAMLGDLAAEAENGAQLRWRGGHNLEIERAGELARLILGLVGGGGEGE